MLNSSDEIYIDLVSNASVEIYADNSLSRFTNRLKEPLRFEGEWAVGIQEIYYPLTYKPIKRKYKIAIIKVKQGSETQTRGCTDHFEYIEGDEITNIVKTINDAIINCITMTEKNQENFADIIMPQVLVGVDNKIIITKGHSKTHSFIPWFFDANILHLLGINPKPFRKQVDEIIEGSRDSIIAKHLPDTAIKSNLIFIYTDIIQEHPVGDTSFRLMRVVPLSRGVFEDVGYMCFSNPIYYPLRTNHIENISIILADENGSEIKFKTGRVYANLHFKKN